MKRYEFESANKGTVTIDVYGEYRGEYIKDIAVTAQGVYAEFEECDDADAIMQALVDGGVCFDSLRSAAFNREVIQSALIDRDATVEELADEAATWDENDIENKLAYIRGL